MGAELGTKHKKFPKDNRDETADYVISTGPVREVARELGLAGGALGDWARRRRAELSGAPAQARPAPDEPRAARRRVEDLEREDAFLRRAVAPSRGGARGREALADVGGGGRVPRLHDGGAAGRVALRPPRAAVARRGARPVGVLGGALGRPDGALRAGGPVRGRNALPREGPHARAGHVRRAPQGAREDDRPGPGRARAAQPRVFVFNKK